MKTLATALILFIAGVLNAQTRSWYNLEAQMTYVYQRKPLMAGGNNGPRSLMVEGEQAATLTSTIFADLKLTRNLILKINPEVAAGGGLSGVNGIAGFPNGEAFRVGSGSPYFYLARGVLEWTIPTPSAYNIVNEEHPLNDSIPSHGWVLAIGKFNLMDYVDGNTFSHDPRDQFLNWTLVSSGAFDYGADLRGYTQGIAATYKTPQWEFDLVLTQMAEDINSNVYDNHLDKAFTLNCSVERQWQTALGAGAIRLLVYQNRARMGSYQQAIYSAKMDSRIPELATVRQYGHTKTGFAVNLEQTLSVRGTNKSGVFAKLSWNDGQNESWAFTEVDESLAIGYQGIGLENSVKGSYDTWGVAMVLNGISAPHQNYLAQGGQGFMLGDGSLDYGREFTTEAYYKYTLLNKGIYLSPDFQLTINPGYNKTRGPAVFLGLRLHYDIK